MTRTEELLQEVVSLLKILVKKQFDSNLRYQEFLKWSLSHKRLGVKAIMDTYGVSRPTALKWLKSLSLYGFRVKIRNGGTGESGAIKR